MKEALYTLEFRENDLIQIEKILSSLGYKDQLLNQIYESLTKCSDWLYRWRDGGEMRALGIIENVIDKIVNSLWYKDDLFNQIYESLTKCSDIINGFLSGGRNDVIDIIENVIDEMKELNKN